MECISYYNFCKKICDDLGIDLQKKIITKYNDFPKKEGKTKINATYNSIIVDKEGLEHPYMLNSNSRNNEKLIDFDHIYYLTSKTLEEIINETNVLIESEKCRICEGGGWHSYGRRYFYKDFYCEI